MSSCHDRRTSRHVLKSFPDVHAPNFCDLLCWMNEDERCDAHTHWAGVSILAGCSITREALGALAAFEKRASSISAHHTALYAQGGGEQRRYAKRGNAPGAIRRCCCMLGTGMVLASLKAGNHRQVRHHRQYHRSRHPLFLLTRTSSESQRPTAHEEHRAPTKS